MAFFSKNKTEEEVKETKDLSKKASKGLGGSKKATKKALEVSTVKTSPALVSTGISAAVPSTAAANRTAVSLTPHVTEKANFHAEKLNSYTFKVVGGNADKKSVARMVKMTYKVTPVKVRIVNTAERSVSYRGRPVHKAGFKKVYVTLKKGDKIEIA